MAGETHKVWIDQDLCTGDGLCAEIAPDIFKMGDDNLAYVTGLDGSRLEGAEGTREVPVGRLVDAIEAAEECPGECIFFDPV